LVVGFVEYDVQPFHDALIDVRKLYHPNGRSDNQGVHVHYFLQRAWPRIVVPSVVSSDRLDIEVDDAIQGTLSTMVLKGTKKLDRQVFL